MLASYQRRGGRRPSEDESLQIDDDGSFYLTRTVGGPRVGSFAGTIPKQSLAAVRQLVADAEDLDDPPAGLPPHVIESVETSRAEITVGAHTTSSSPAARLVKRMRRLANDLTASPVAALELRIAEDGRTVTIASVGADPVDADFSDASLTFTLYGPDEALLTAGEIDPPTDLRSKTALRPGWSTELPVEGDVAFSPKRTLDVQMEFVLLDGNGDSRRARLRATAGKGWAR
jgi:hypothetical protein